MGQEPLPFLSDDVARSKRNRETARIFLVSALVWGFASLSAKDWPHMLVRLELIDAIPLSFLVLFIRRVLPGIRFKSVVAAIIARSVTYTVFFLAAVELVALSLSHGSQINESIVKYPGIYLLALIGFYIWVIAILGLRGIIRKLGQGEFWNWVRGYYYNPKEEERIFMFLDMRNSTELAERLGDLKFSKLVRDFFDDLTSPIVETRATVSHYIGDEAVLTWWPRDGLSESLCLQCFFRMQAIIDRRRPYYVAEYGIVPNFKAGAHIGSVVATEVGQVKSEIVFHGDVLNTTARVQAACSEHGVDFLITEALASRLPETSWLELQPIGEVALKGKSEPVTLLAASVRTK